MTGTPPVDAQPVEPRCRCGETKWAPIHTQTDSQSHEYQAVDAQPVEPLTAEEIVAPHYPVPGYPEFCHRDGQRWPCDVIRLDAARAGDGLLREAAGEMVAAHDAFRGALVWAEGNDAGLVRVHKAAEALRAALHATATERVPYDRDDHAAREGVPAADLEPGG